MKVIRVQYTIDPSFVEKNKENIAAVMKELRDVGSSDVKYFASQHEDGNTFMHVVVYKDGGSEELPASLDSFRVFQKELKENIVTPPKAETFSVVDSSFELF